jgi:hypothetical protein
VLVHGASLRVLWGDISIPPRCDAAPFRRAAES